MPRTILEPSCGDGAIVAPLRAAGYKVYASDLVARGCPDSTLADFLAPFEVPSGIEGVITNPPFKIAPAFITKALTLAPYVVMLARVAFLEGMGRKLWFETSPLARVHVSSRRLPMMHRNGETISNVSSAMAFAWFVWDARHVGEPVIRWFDWKDHYPTFEDLL